MKQYVILKATEVTKQMLTEGAADGMILAPVSIILADESDSGYVFLSIVPGTYPASLQHYKKLNQAEFLSEKAVVEAGGKPTNKVEPVKPVQQLLGQDETKFYGVGFEIQNSTKGQTVHHDFLLEESLQIRGGFAEFKNHIWGDYLSIKVVDVDNILGYGEGVEVATYVKKWFIPTGFARVEVDDYSVAAIPAGLYFRVSYTSTADPLLGQDVDGIVNLYSYLPSEGA